MQFNFTKSNCIPLSDGNIVGCKIVYNSGEMVEFFRVDNNQVLLRLDAVDVLNIASNVRVMMEPNN